MQKRQSWKITKTVSNRTSILAAAEENVYLRFGVKFDEDYNATYHANYAGCENEDGIMGYTPQELLEKLMKKGA